METREKTDLLGNLYTLRAGLSVISQKNDSIKTLNKKSITAIRAELLNKNNMFMLDNENLNIPDDLEFKQCNICGKVIPNNISECPMCRAEDFTPIAEYKTYSELDKYYISKFPLDKLENKKAEKSQLENNISKIKSQKTILTASIIIISLFSAILLGLSCYFLINKKFELGIPFMIIGTLTISVICFLTAKNKKISNRLKNCNERINILNNFIKYYPTVRNFIIEKISEKNNKALTIKQNCLTLFEFLQKTYLSILDIRDWKHLDLVIYYIETKRADSIKEALQCVDREMQTQRIENAIQQATAQICNTLALGFTVLQQTIENGYRSISAQIASSTAAISAQLSELTSAVNMNNALRAKANVSSEQLVKDVQALRNYIVK